MNLRDWILDNGLRQSDFAELIDVSRAHLSSVICGTRPAGRKLAKAIERVTKGDITANSVLIGDTVGYEGKIKRLRVKGEKKEPCRQIFSLI